jgi:peptidoglycan/LPS O-acetylase OafA/YrhL
MIAKTEEIPALTGIRAYAAIWVMLLHLQFSSGVMLDLGPVIKHGFWAVDVFFVLSGFILSLLYAQRFETGVRAVYRDYLVARFARIYPLHLAALLFLLACFTVRGQVVDTPHPPGFDMRHFWLNLGLLHAWGYADQLSWNYPSWSISCEWFAYLLLTPLLSLGLRRWSAPACLLLAALGWAGLYLAVHAQGDRIGELTISWAVLRIAVEFTLGYALYRIHARYRWHVALSDVMALTGLGGIVLLTLLPAVHEIWLAPAIALLLLGLARSGPLGQRLFANRVAVFWGERSYSIYMLHAVVQIVSNLTLGFFDLELSRGATPWLLLLVLSSSVLLASHLAYLWIELPARNGLRGWLQARKGVETDGDRPLAVEKAS